jgi:hypothetical protein
MPVQRELATVLDGVASARSEPLTSHLAATIKIRLASAIASIVNDPISYKVEGSPGKGNCAETVGIGHRGHH